MKKIKDFMFKNKNIINIVFSILEIILVMLLTGRGRENNTYLYLFFITFAIHQGFHLMNNLKYTNKQRAIRFVAGVVGGVLLWKSFKIIF